MIDRYFVHIMFMLFLIPAIPVAMTVMYSPDTATFSIDNAVQNIQQVITTPTDELVARPRSAMRLVPEYELI